TIIGDQVAEAVESFTAAITVSNANGQPVTIGTGSASATITDDDDATITIDNVSVDEDILSGEVTFTVNINRSLQDAFSIDFLSKDGTATLTDNDYLSANGTITFNPGETSKTISVTINADKKTELDEVFTVELSNPTINGRNITVINSIGVGTILNDDHSPIVNNIAKTGMEDINVFFTNIDFNNAYTDADSDPLTHIKVNSLPTNGILSLGGSPINIGQTIPLSQLGDIIFTPTSNWFGVTSFNYNATDGTNWALTDAIVTITINSVNDNPIAVDDLVSTPEDTPVNGSVTLNDTDIEGDHLVVTEFVVDGSTYTSGTTATISNVGTLVIEQNGTFKFIPVQNFNGIVPTISYTISDGNGGTDIGDLFISVDNKNDPPVIVDENLTVCSNDILSGNILSNGDIDPDGTILTVSTTPVNGPAHGKFSITSEGAFIYTPDTGFNGTDQITVTVCDNGIPLPARCTNDIININVVHAVLANAGDNAKICEGSAFITGTATAINTASLAWTTSGTGTFTDASALHTEYRPSEADISAGIIMLTITANGESPCGTISDTMVLTISRQVTVFAGVDAKICEGSKFRISSATTEHAGSLTWTSSGTGIFNDTSIINPEYTPSSADVASGSIILTLTANGESTCGNKSDAMYLSFSLAATIHAGSDSSICEGSDYSLDSATAIHATNLIWTSSGTGVFNNASVIRPVYTPSEADITSGSVILTLTANTESTCGSVSDQIVLSISHQAKVNAGVDATMGEGTAYQINTATSLNAVSLVWTTSGTGRFNNANVINPEYTPGEADLAKGNVTLTLTANAEIPCSLASDAMVLTLTTQVIVNAGSDVSLCGNSPHVLSDASIINATELTWKTNGTGTFNNSKLINATYSPSAADILSGQVILTLTSGKTEDSLLLSLSANPAVNAGSDREACFGEPVAINNATARNYSGITWITSGLGEISASNTLIPVYKPALNETGDIKLIAIVSGIGYCDSQNVTDSMIIRYHEQMVVFAGESDTILINTKAILSASVYPQTGNYTYSWSPAELVQNSTSNQTETTDLSSNVRFVLTATNVQTGCQVKDSVLIVIENNIDNLLNIRNGITPNGDGDNDIWWIDGIEKFPDNEIMIFNRWGDKIIEFRNYDNNKVAWDGKNKLGNLVTDGTYYYMIKINGIKSYTGWINLRSGSN
ncbi:MAG: Ig-like domain-containing protein, partial [Bacteroidia bacterium]